MNIPIEAENPKGFTLVDDRGSPRERFERRAAEIARAAEMHVRKMVEEEAALCPEGPPPTESWAVEPETRDGVPFGLQRRVTLRIPVFRREEAREDEVEELRRVRGLMAQIALDLIGQILAINRYFADAGLVKPPELGPAPGRRSAQERRGASVGNTMSGGSAGSSLRRRA